MGSKVGLEAEMRFPVSETYSLPINAKTMVGSVMANFCGSHYPLNMTLVEVSSQKVMIDEAFLVPKCVRLAQMSLHSHQLLRKKWGAVAGTRVYDLRDV